MARSVWEYDLFRHLERDENLRSPAEVLNQWADDRDRARPVGRKYRSRVDPEGL
jgi:hypothetical protein